MVVWFLIVSTRRRHRRVAARSIKEFRAVFLNVLWFFFSIRLSNFSASESRCCPGGALESVQHMTTCVVAPKLS